jgi:hypothetical protein
MNTRAVNVNLVRSFIRRKVAIMAMVVPIATKNMMPITSKLLLRETAPSDWLSFFHSKQPRQPEQPPISLMNFQDIGSRLFSPGRTDFYSSFILFLIFLRIHILDPLEKAMNIFAQRQLGIVSKVLMNPAWVFIQLREWI